jgi:tetratricopeptide (TPR) repeat protein
VAFDVALARGVHTFEDIGRSLQAACRAVELASPKPSEEQWSAAATLGRLLYLSGQTTEARAVLEEAAHDLPPANRQPYVVVNMLALLSLLAGDAGDDATAAALAQQAMDAADAEGVSFDPLNAIVYIALGRAAARRDGLADAEQLLEQALQMLGGIGSFVVQYAQALLEIASVRHARGEIESARATVKGARALISQFADPGMLPSLLDSTERGMRRTAHRRPRPAAPPPLPSGSLRSWGCFPPGYRPERSAASCMSRSVQSGRRCRPSIASWRSRPGPMRSPARASSTCSPGRHIRTGSHFIWVNRGLG